VSDVGNENGRDDALDEYVGPEVRSAVLPEAGVELSIWISADRSGQATIMVEDVVGRVADSVIGRIGQMADCLVEVAQ